MILADKVRQAVEEFEEIKLLYLFGSQVGKKSTELSDYDFAIFLDEKTSGNREKEIILRLSAKLSLILKRNNIDLVILNRSLSPLLKFMVLKEGKLLYQKEPYRVIVEPTIYSEYFDFQLFKHLPNI